MVAFNKFDVTEKDIAAGIHANVFNADTDVVKAYFSNAAPSASLDLVKADLAEISAGNGYTAGGVDVQNARSKTGGVTTVAATDFTVTASGGSIGPFQYIVFYNDTAASDNLLGWCDNGTPVTLADGESFTTDFGASLMTHQ